RQLGERPIGPHLRTADLRGQGAALVGGGQIFHPAVGGIHRAQDQTAGLHAVRDAGQVGRVAGPASGQFTHGQFGGGFVECQQEFGLGESQAVFLGGGQEVLQVGRDEPSDQ